MWNWGDQEYFGLCRVGIPEEAEASVRTGLREILQSFDPALGIDKEWKYTANNLFNRELMEKVIHLLAQNKGRIYVDITNKKFKIVHYFVDYCNIFLLFVTKSKHS